MEKSEKSISPIAYVLVVAGMVGCLAMTGLMPWAELQLNGKVDNWPTWLRVFANPLVEIGSKQYSDLTPKGEEITQELKARGAESSYGDYVYAVLLGSAMTAAAIGIAAIGREDAEEKTVIPEKK